MPPGDDDRAQARTLQRNLQAGGHDCAVEWVESTASTNSDLLRQLRDGQELAQCLVARHQSAGRGRRARPWIDEAAQDPGQALLCSLAWPLPRDCDLSGLSLMVGVCVVHALQTVGLQGAGLKWPNDVLLRQRKLAGVLVEVCERPQARWIVAGIGLNLRSPAALPEAIGLHEAGVEVDRWQVLSALLPRLCFALREFAATGFATWAQEWNRLHAWGQRPVQVLADAAAVVQGIAQGVDERGYLWLHTAEGSRRVGSGDVSLREDH